MDKKSTTHQTVDKKGNKIAATQADKHLKQGADKKPVSKEYRDSERMPNQGGSQANGSSRNGVESSGSIKDQTMKNGMKTQDKRDQQSDYADDLRKHEDRNDLDETEE